jgi:multidrug resistance efflux pump
VLVRLEDSEFVAQVNQAKANLASAQAQLDRLRTGSRPEEKLKDKAAVMQAEANLKSAEAEYQRAEALFRSGVTSKAEYDRVLAQRDSATAMVQAARQSSTMTDIGPRKEEITAAAATVNQMKAALDYANTQLAATEIKAPVTGTVLARSVEPGEMVSPSAFGGSGARTSVVDLADLTGNLDARSGEEILNILSILNRELEKTIMLVTHDPHAASFASEQMHLEKGVLTELEPVASRQISV